MQTCSMVIQCAQGLHARPCTALAVSARSFNSNITLTFHGSVYDMCDPISLMTAGVVAGDEIILTVSGNDEEEAMAALKKIFEEDLL